MASSIFVNLSGELTSTSAPITGDGSSGNPITVDLSGYGTKAGTLAQFAATTSAQLAGVISDETGTGALAFANTPTFVTPVLGAATGTSVNVSGNVRGASFNVGATAGVDASIVIPAVATITVSKGIITAVV